MCTEIIFGNRVQSQTFVSKRIQLNLQDRSLQDEKYSDIFRTLTYSFNHEISFAQFLAKEKRNLRCFPSFEKTNTAKAKRCNQNHLEKNNHSSSYNLSNTAYDEATVTIIPTLQMNETQSMQKAQSIIDTNGEKCIHCVERHISYMNDSQTKAAICLVRQLNMYMSQKDLRSKKVS